MEGLKRRMCVNVPLAQQKYIRVGYLDPAVLKDLLSSSYFTEQGMAHVASQCQINSAAVTPVVTGSYVALDDETLNCTGLFCHVYKGHATGLRTHQDHTFFTWRITGKAMGKAQLVKFSNKKTDASFTLLHLPNTWYAGEEHLMSVGHDNEWEHGVSKEDRTDDAIVSLIVDFGPEQSIFHNGSKWLYARCSAPDRSPQSVT